MHYSVRQFLIKEIEKRKLTVNRDTMRKIANELRTTFGPSYIVEQLYLQAEKTGKDAIIESIRAVGEVKALKKYPNFFLLAIDADQKRRYERAISRGSETDHITREQFQAQEQAEMNNSDESKQNLSQCIQLADLVIQNNGTIEQLYEQLKQI